MTQPVIHWFRRDLRLIDNTALHHAVTSGSPVIPVFIFDHKVYGGSRSGAPRMAFMLKALESLDTSLKTLGSRLIIMRGNPVEQLHSLIAQTNASAVYYNADYTPYSTKRDQQLLEYMQVPVHCYHDVYLMPPGTVLKPDKTPYTIFTPYKNTWNSHTKPASQLTQFSSTTFYNNDSLHSLALPTLNDLGFSEFISVPAASEEHAQTLLERFIHNSINNYSEQRNSLPVNPFGDEYEEGTSYLSPYLRLGIISPRVCYEAARTAWTESSDNAYRQSITTWVSELTWRDFYGQILDEFPHVLTRDFVNTYRDMEWRHAPDDLRAWQDGMTGYPIIDAPMRQLKSIGWMPNRARMIVASFLTKHLLIHWLEGDKHFMHHLIDGDTASNNGGWQWAAGTGTDAQPYFRIFNPITQSQKFATPYYLRYWLPELKNVPDKYIHKPWESQVTVDYPPPIVDHSFARARTLSAFKKARGEKVN